MRAFRTVASLLLGVACVVTGVPEGRAQPAAPPGAAGQSASPTPGAGPAAKAKPGAKKAAAPSKKGKSKSKSKSKSKTKKGAPVANGGATAGTGDRAAAGAGAVAGKRPRRKGCPKGMVSVLGAFCIDQYEAATVELLPGGKVKAHSPYEPVAGLDVKAVSAKGKVPQGYISRDEAERACSRAGKRLCRDDEWLQVCRGKKKTVYPYGDAWTAGRCNDQGRAGFNELHGGNGQPPPESAYDWENLNDPRLNRMKGTVAPAGQFGKCKSSFGAYDMVGNLHEWTAAPAGTFRGGYYLDVHQNGDGCDYRTTAHDPKYHDYSTGFRCCL
ncbi:MAG: SUMF1/EgtB/PvdO family nonheme iron enzyme [Polyangiaceae bacterium]|nr:SUMF1/EgtB/PvdO family nonheme iron enzyme [Polyangiaceae bacterium]